jgi:hypothetical protein
MRVASFIGPGNGRHPGRELVLYGVTSNKCFRTAAAARGKRRRPATGTNASRHAPRSQRKRPRKACAALPVRLPRMVTAPHSMSTRAASRSRHWCRRSLLWCRSRLGTRYTMCFYEGKALAIFVGVVACHMATGHTCGGIPRDLFLVGSELSSRERERRKSGGCRRHAQPSPARKRSKVSAAYPFFPVSGDPHW